MLILGQFVDWVRYNTLGVGEAVRQIIFVGIAFEVLSWDDKQYTAVLQAISALLAVIAAKTNVSAPKVEDRIVEAKSTSFAKGQAEGQRLGGEPTP